MNCQTVPYTSTLPNVVMEEILEDEEIKNELQNTFKIALNDKDLEAMAEEGLGDYLLQLKQLDK